MSFGDDYESPDDIDNLKIEVESRSSKEIPLNKKLTFAPTKLNPFSNLDTDLNDLSEEKNENSPSQMKKIKSEILPTGKFGIQKNLNEKIEMVEKEKLNESEKVEESKNKKVNQEWKKEDKNSEKEKEDTKKSVFGQSSEPKTLQTISASNPVINPLKAVKEASKKKEIDENSLEEKSKEKEDSSQKTSSTKQGLFGQDTSLKYNPFSSIKTENKLGSGIGVFKNQPSSFFGSKPAIINSTNNPTLGSGTFGQSSFDQALASNTSHKAAESISNPGRTFGSKKTEEKSGFSGFKSVVSSSQPKNSFLASGGNNNDMDDEDIFGNNQPAQPGFGFNNPSPFTQPQSTGFTQPQNPGFGQPGNVGFGQSKPTISTSLGFNPKSNPSFTQRRK